MGWFRNRRFRQRKVGGGLPVGRRRADRVARRRVFEVMFRVAELLVSSTPKRSAAPVPWDVVRDTSYYGRGPPFRFLGASRLRTSISMYVCMYVCICIYIYVTTHKIDFGKHGSATLSSTP